MNIYFPPTEQSELNFPTNNLPIKIINSITNFDELKEKNPDVDEIINERDGEITQFYKKYKAKDLDKTTAQKKLNKIKVYLIVKPKIVKGKKVNFAIPIRNYDDLGTSVLERSKSFIAGFFYVRLNNQGSTALRPFVLDHLMATIAPFGAEEEITLESLILPKEYGIDGIRLPVLPDKISKYGYLDESVGGPFSAEYDYDYSMVDNTTFRNVARYATNPRYKKSFDAEKSKPNLLNRIKEINFKEDVLKLFDINNFVDFILGDQNPTKEKNIIPVFSKLEDAQNLLITVLEEVNQPFKARRQIETSNTPKYYRSLDYLDDSFTFQNRYFLPDPTDRGDVITDFLRRYRFIKPRNNTSYDGKECYNENHYQIKGPFYLEDTETDRDLDEYVPMSQRPKFAPKNIWRETDYWTFRRIYFPNQPNEYSWLETRDLTEADKGVLKNSQDIKIVSMGLSDFLEFWNNPKQKTADVLFVPSLDNSIKKKLPILSNRFSKKSRDRFYDYQQKFRGSKKQDTENYIYEIKISS